MAEAVGMSGLESVIDQVSREKTGDCSYVLVHGHTYWMEMSAIYVGGNLCCMGGQADLYEERLLVEFPFIPTWQCHLYVLQLSVLF